MQMDKVPTATFKATAMERLGIIRRESERLTRLIENVLDFSKMEHHTKRYQLEYHDVAEVLRLTIDSFRPHAESSGFSLEVEVEEPLPELLLDADAIAQVILNLLSNAVQYSDEVKQILVRAYRDGDVVAIAVADRGIGIAADELPRVFDKFYSGRHRMDSRQSSGLGLGLTLARSIARAHGGDIQVRSEPGEGSTFTVTLPVPPADEAAVGQAGALRESSA
jgi:signal transduction histidine kinase